MKQKLPKHRKLLMESMALLFSNNKFEFKKKIKKAKKEINNYYKK